MTRLSEDFCRQMQAVLPEAEDYRLFLEVLEGGRGPTSLRLNPLKSAVPSLPQLNLGQAVPWASQAYYLAGERPIFALDPAWHQGRYYVQEAASMFLEQALTPVLADLGADKALKALDLCAAPGGKTTQLISLLPSGSLLLANEVIKHRANILDENLQKWAYPGVLLSSQDPARLAQIGPYFDLVLVDAPCSGEGLFRRQPESRAEWSLEAVQQCALRSRRILAEAWAMLRPGGWLIFSTCTYNQTENEAQLLWLQTEFGAEGCRIPCPTDWGIEESLSGQGLYGYRFYPHRQASEGFFCALLRKPERGEAERPNKSGKKSKVGTGLPKLKPEIRRELQTWLEPPMLDKYELILDEQSEVLLWPQAQLEAWSVLQTQVKPFQATGHLASPAGRELKPHPYSATLPGLKLEAFPHAELSLEQALEVLQLGQPSGLEHPQQGWFRFLYQGQGLSWAKNLGKRFNSAYPKYWKLRMNLPN